MRATRWLTACLAVAVVFALGADARADEAESAALARTFVERCRGDKHRESMRVVWAEIEDEVPPAEAEVLLVTGLASSFGMNRVVLRGDAVDATSLSSAGPGTKKQPDRVTDAATHAVTPARFALAWNAMRRIVAAAEEPILPAPSVGRGVEGRHACSRVPHRWMRVRAAPQGPPVLVLGRGAGWVGQHDLRPWSRIRDEAVFALFADFARADASVSRPANVAVWTDLAAEELRAASPGLSADQIDRDGLLLRSCLRLLGEAGPESAEVVVAALKQGLMAMDAAGRTRHSSIYDEAARAAVQLRIRHHFSRDGIRRALSDCPRGKWRDDEHWKWLRAAFRTRDPAGFAELVAEELTSYGLHPDDIPALAAQIAALPSPHPVAVLQGLLGEASPQLSPEVRLEAAIALHGVDPGNVYATKMITALALDRSIACRTREDTTGRWVRTRALVAALDWGGLTPAGLREHVLAPQSDDLAFLREAARRLRRTPATLTADELRDTWRRLLDAGTSHRVLAAVEFLVDGGDVESRDRMVAAIDRIAGEAGEHGPDAATLAPWREFAAAVRARGDVRK